MKNPVPQSLAVLDENTCGKYATHVHELSDRWTRRHPKLPFFTLGAASYLDAANGQYAKYIAKAKVENPWIRDEFSPLIDSVAAALEEHLGGTVRFDPEFALPGFHVFQAHEEFSKPMASVHFDLQHESLDWSRWPGVDPLSQISFTLPLRLPAAGGGLHVWDIDLNELRNLPYEERMRIVDARRAPEYVPYGVGTLAIQSGHFLHQIAPLRDQTAADERVTLQGHGLKTGNTWIIYW